MSADLNELRCNNLRCRKVLSEEGRAVVTTCSHIFCVDCAEMLFGATKQCPACETQLTEPDDVVICSLNPSNDYKTSVLSGLAPSLVMEIATRALSFWTYQTTQEGAYQSLLLHKTQDRNVALERQLQMATSEISMLKNKIHGLEREVESEKRKSRDLAETARVKEREYGKLKSQYDKMKRKSLLVPSSDAAATITLGDGGRLGSQRSAGGGVGLGSFMDDRSTPIKQPTVNQPWPPQAQTPPLAHSRTVSASSATSAFAGGGSGTRPFHPGLAQDGRGMQGYDGSGFAPGAVGTRSGSSRMSSVGVDGSGGAAGGWGHGAGVGQSSARAAGQQRRFGQM